MPPLSTLVTVAPFWEKFSILMKVSQYTVLGLVMPTYFEMYDWISITVLSPQKEHFMRRIRFA